MLIYIVFNVNQVFDLIFLSHFCNINPGSRMISLLVMLIFLFYRNLDLRLTYIISESRVLGGFSFVSILIISLVLTEFVFLGGSITFWTLRIDFHYFKK